MITAAIQMFSSIFLLATCLAFNPPDLRHSRDQAPPRPPAPALIGTGSSFLTLSMQLNTKDYARTDKIEPITKYEMQMKNKTGSLDFIDVWINTGIKIAPSNSPGQLATATVLNLVPSEGYRFRSRAINKIGSSLWSSESDTFYTESTIPPAPLPPTATALHVRSIEISWKMPLAKPRTSPPLSYDIQYRMHVFKNSGKDGIDNHLKWVNSTMSVSAVATRTISEVQEVTTLVHNDLNITSGAFWLTLRCPRNGVNTDIKQSSFVSAPILFNATSEQFKNAILNIHGITQVYVYRYRPGSQGDSVHSERGTYSWRIEFDSSLNPLPLMEVYKDTLNSKASLSIRKLQEGKDATFKESLLATVNNLQSYTSYDFRVRAINSKGIGPWSEPLLGIFTSPILANDSPNQPSPLQLNSKYVMQVQGIGRQAANRRDTDYIQGAGMGGVQESNGRDGLVVVTHDDGQGTLSRTKYYYTGTKQSYVVPGRRSSPHKVETSLAAKYITVKIWGAGGAGGTGEKTDFSIPKYNSVDFYDSELSHGGGGGYVEARIKVYPLETLAVLVGGGGKSNGNASFSLGGSGGFGGGGKGGNVVKGHGGGGGGGYSSVIRDSSLLAAAGGGGGAGSSNRCCAHGGPGGGLAGGNGHFPNTPTDENLASGRKYTHTTQCIDTTCYVFKAHNDSSSSYKTLATGGLGGDHERRGEPGLSESTYLHGVSTNALPGGYGFGGDGAEGIEGGGGGGAGFMGGGGGGSGVDAAGGGGGCGFVNFSAVYIPDNNERGRVDNNRPLPPAVTFTSHNSIAISWNTDHLAGFDLHGFEIELSRGREGSGREGGKCSDDFELVDFVLATYLDVILNATITGLAPQTAYCIRVIAIASQGMSRRSSVVETATLASPANQWLYVTPRNYYNGSKDGIKKGAAFHSTEHGCQVSERPPPRRGHTLNEMNGIVFLFGGKTNTCACLGPSAFEDEQANSDTEEICNAASHYSNEVWSFDPHTRIWTNVQRQISDPLFPGGREQHSSTVLANGKIVVIGGRAAKRISGTTSYNHVYFGDVWEMDPGQATIHIIQGSLQQILPAKITDGNVLYHSVNVSIPERQYYRRGEQCIKSVQISLSLQHSCVEQIGYIAIFGPDDTIHQRGNSIKLFVSSASEHICSSVTSNITFSDAAEESILDYSFILPTIGTFRPAQSLTSNLFGNRVSGEWTLAVYDMFADQIVGTLLDWSIQVEVEYCEEGLLWSKLHTNSCEIEYIVDGESRLEGCSSGTVGYGEKLTPRRLHTALAIGNDVYVMGGYSAHEQLKDVWKLDYDSKVWILLHCVLGAPFLHGRSAALTPWGMFAFGGMREGGPLEQSVWHFDLMREEWSLVTVESRYLTEAPESRYLSAVCYIGRNKQHFERNAFDNRTGDFPVLLLFGGASGSLTGSFLGDLWALPVQAVVTDCKDDTKHEEFCNWRLAANIYWNTSCGDPHTTELCRWQDILTMAWCLKQYQNFVSPA